MLPREKKKKKVGDRHLWLTCNPSYSGSRDQEDHGSKLSGQIVPETLSPQNPSQEMAGGMAQGVDLGFKTQFCKKKNKKLWGQKMATNRALYL
jgi:hypothetical protein